MKAIGKKNNNNDDSKRMKRGLELRI